MNDLGHLRDLLAHCAWADAMFFHAWGKVDRGDGELRDRFRHSNATASYFLKVLTHTMDVDWDGILKGEVRPPWLDRPLPAYEELSLEAQQNHAALVAFAGALEPGSMQREVRIPWFPEPPCTVSVAEALVQVALHTQHHRGQAMTRLKIIGGKPVNVDYLIWLWKGRPEARWD